MNGYLNVPSVFVLYIEDQIVSPHLELLRNVCEPRSKARPHITVRYFNKLAIPTEYFEVKVDYVDLIDVGSFGINEDQEQPNKTVFIKCHSDELLRLEHKPLFPTSQFHITLYDGKSEALARALISVLSNYNWSFRIPLPTPASLVQLQIKAKRRKAATPTVRIYRPEICALFKQLTGEELSHDTLQLLTEDERIRIVRLICDSLASTLDRYDRIDAAAYEGITYAAKSDKDYHMHLTPPELAFDIATFALKQLSEEQRENIHFGDPAVGTGAFFAALLAATDSENIRSAIGVDISPAHVAAARWRWQRRGMEVIEEDYLHIGDLPARNLVLANPPYLRHQGIDPEYKKELRQRASADIGMRISGLSGQYLYFLLLGHRWLEPDAVGAWLIPSEFMQTAYGKALRYYLSRTVHLVRVHIFSPKDRQFENAETLPCVVVFRNRTPDQQSVTEFTIGGTLNNPESNYRVSSLSLSVDTKWSPVPRTPKRRDDSYVRLGDLFDVRRGIATGANEFFVLERDKAASLGIPIFALKPIIPKAKSLESDVIEGDNDGFPIVEKQLCVIDCNLTIDEISENYPTFHTYLKQAEQTGILSRYLVSRRRPWYKQEQREPAPFLCTYMGKANNGKPAIRFIRNDSKAIAMNTYLMLYPKPALKRLMSDSPSAKNEVFQLLKEASLDAMEEFARTHAGGLTKIEPRELLEVWVGPLPEHIKTAASQKLFETYA